MPAAPEECFKQRFFDESFPNNFKVADKLEAKDARNLSAISVATVVQIQGPRLCLRLDGTDGCNDFWRLIDSRDIFPLGTCEAHGGLLQPPLGYTRNVSTWPAFLQRTLRNANQAHADCFYEEPPKPSSNLFEIGMKLEAVDRKNPHLICPATIGDVDGDQIFVSFDGWRGAFDYWCAYDSRDLFPCGWCQKHEHPIQEPGKRGDNPIVIDKLKLFAERSKRQTRSVKSNLDQKQPVKDLPPAQSKEKPVRRRRVDSIKATNQTDNEKSNDVPPEEEKFSPANSDESSSSDESESSPEPSQEKRRKLSSNVDGENENNANQFGSTPDSDPSSSVKIFPPPHSEDQDSKKIDRLERKQKKKERKLARALKRAGIAQDQIGAIKEDGVALSLSLTPQQIALLTSPRKHNAVGEPEYIKSKLKKKKKKRKLIEPTYTRMEGFGPKSGDQITPNNAPSTSSPTSPSFLDAVSSPPTSLFGVDKSQIVRSATQGWPARLQMGSVVTSDNKLGRFDKHPAEKNTDTAVSTKIASEPKTPHCVSTTTNESDRASPKGAIQATKNSQTTTAPHVTSTTVVETPPSEDASKVSSTTNNLPSSQSAPVEPSSSNQSANGKVSSTVSTLSSSCDHRRSRNPKKWSIADVIDYVKEKEPALLGHICVFQKHEIDGKAFLLLNSNNIVKYMGLKLGPALKLCNLVENLKSYVQKCVSKSAMKK